MKPVYGGLGPLPRFKVQMRGAMGWFEPGRVLAEDCDVYPVAERTSV